MDKVYLSSLLLHLLISPSKLHHLVSEYPPFKIYMSHFFLLGGECFQILSYKHIEFTTWEGWVLATLCPLAPPPVSRGLEQGQASESANTQVQ